MKTDFDLVVAFDAIHDQRDPANVPEKYCQYYQSAWRDIPNARYSRFKFS